MSRHDSAPTMGWVISSQVNKWLALGFVLVVLIGGVSVWTLYYTINRDCQNYYKRDASLFGHWVHIRIGSTKDGCPDPWKGLR